MRILLTGITGFVGSHMADYILARHPNQRLYGVRRWHRSRMDHVRRIRDHIHWIDCDLTDPVAVHEMIDRTAPDRIFHFAAESFVSPSWLHPTAYMRANYDATVNILEALRRAKARTPILIPGSGEEFGDILPEELPIHPEAPMRPVNPYAVSKMAQDHIGYVYFRSYGLPVVRVRAFNHEGPRRDKVFGIPSYAWQIARIEADLMPPRIRVGHLDDKRNFTHVQDMVHAYWLAMEKCQPGELYLIGSEEESSVSTFGQALHRLIELARVPGIVYEQVEEFTRPTNVPLLIADTTKFRAATGWKPAITFEQILTDTLAYWRDRVAKGTD